MNATQLKQWQSDLGLSELAMARYLGVPVNTLIKWTNGTRTPDAAPQRLFEVLRLIQSDAPAVHARLVQDARSCSPDQAPAKRGRPARGIVAPIQENAPEALESTVPEIPGWLTSAL